MSYKQRKVIKMSSDEKNRLMNAIETRYDDPNRISTGLAIAELAEEAVFSGDGE